MTRQPKRQITKREIAAIHAFYAPAYGKQAPEVPKARAPSRDLEHKEQCAVIQWWHMAHKGFGVPETLLFAVPNGGSRHMLTAVRLKAEGVRAGVSDLFLAQARYGYNGAFLEMKAPEGRMSTEQAQFHEYASNAGYATVTCYGADEAIAFIKRYLRG